MSYHSIVLVKQVPDTANISGEAMKEDGTINRAALPAIFNPHDLHALELALQVKEQHGGRVSVLTMGPPRAAEVLRQALYRGADQAFLLSDRKFAGSDTLATSYALQCAVEQVGTYDLIFCGQQAIDGDTGQVGPQVAEKLNLPQITYAESIVSLQDRRIVVERAFPLGKETVACTLPCLLTVVGTAASPRPPSARRMLAHKLAATPLEYTSLLAKWPEFATEQDLDAYLSERGLKIPVWTADDVGADAARLGLEGSPTKVLKVDYVVIEASESKEISTDQEGISSLISDLVQEYIL